MPVRFKVNRSSSSKHVTEQRWGIYDTSEAIGLFYSQNLSISALLKALLF